MGILDKAKDFLKSDEVEEKTDAVLDKVEELAAEKLDADKAAKVSEIREAIDKKIGNDE